MGFMLACKKHSGYSEFITWDENDEEMAPGHFAYNCVINGIQIRVADWAEEGIRVGEIDVQTEEDDFPRYRFYNKKGDFAIEILPKNFDLDIEIDNAKEPEENINDLRKLKNRFFMHLTKAELCYQPIKNMIPQAPLLNQLGLDCDKDKEVLDYFFNAHKTFKKDIV